MTECYKSFEVQAQEKLENIISLSLTKGMSSGIRASIAYIRQMKIANPNVTVDEILDGLMELWDQNAKDLKVGI